MKNLFLLALISLVQTPVFAVDIQEPCEVVREFNCEFSYKLDSGESLSGTANMIDYKYLFAGDSCEVYQSRLTLNANNARYIYATEDDNNANDIEESRYAESDNTGWSGKEFYMSLGNDRAIMTSSIGYQIGNDQRGYQLAVLQPSEEGELELVGKGQMSCTKAKSK